MYIAGWVLLFKCLSQQKCSQINQTINGTYLETRRRKGTTGQQTQQALTLGQGPFLQPKLVGCKIPSTADNPATSHPTQQPKKSRDEKCTPPPHPKQPAKKVFVKQSFRYKMSCCTTKTTK